MPNFQVIFDQIFREQFVYGHLPYLLFVASVLMRDIKWLRIIAIVAGLLRIYIRAKIVYDPVTVMWESTLVVVNIAQLGIMWWDGRHVQMNEEEQFFAREVLPGESRSSALQILATAECREVAAGTVLTAEGQLVARLMFVAEGAARIVKGGAIVAICSRGDYLGEMSFISGGVASATAIADKPMRIISFDNERLAALLARHVVLRRALEASFNRNLIDKLARSSAMPAVEAEAV
jgi:hypothetical protein